MLFSSTSAFLAVLLIALVAVLVISRWARRLWKPIAVGASAACVAFLVVGLVARSHEQAHARAQLRSDTRFVAEEVVQAEQQKLKSEGAFSGINYQSKKLSVQVTAVDGTHANAHVWSKVLDLRFKITPSGAKPNPAVSG